MSLMKTLATNVTRESLESGGELIKLQHPTGAKTFYKLQGEEDSKKGLVVCVHGLGAYHYHWKGLTPVLVTAGYRVLSLDLYGRGFSDCVDENSIAVWVQQIHELLEATNLLKAYPNYNLIGHSMGGLICLSYAHTYPDEVNSMSLLSPAGSYISLSLSLSLYIYIYIYITY